MLLDVTYHPNWRREDGGPVYAVTPLRLLTFVKRDARLHYDRRWFETAGLVASALTLTALCLFALAPLWRRTAHTTIAKPADSL